MYKIISFILLLLKSPPFTSTVTLIFALEKENNILNRIGISIRQQMLLSIEPNLYWTQNIPPISLIPV